VRRAFVDCLRKQQVLASSVGQGTLVVVVVFVLHTCGCQICIFRLLHSPEA
jgi:hypothetical protein